MAKPNIRETLVKHFVMIFIRNLFIFIISRSYVDCVRFQFDACVKASFNVSILSMSWSGSLEIFAFGIPRILFSCDIKLIIKE